jgi:hypothetical protein
MVLKQTSWKQFKYSIRTKYLIWHLKSHLNLDLTSQRRRAANCLWTLKNYFSTVNLYKIKCNKRRIRLNNYSEWVLSRTTLISTCSRWTRFTTRVGKSRLALRSASISWRLSESVGTNCTLMQPKALPKAF